MPSSAGGAQRAGSGWDRGIMERNEIVKYIGRKYGIIE